MNYIVVITGATASGKSSFSLEIAKELNGEIINADIGSFYTPLKIGTAKPDWQWSEIPHHLFDCISETRDETIVAFRERVKSLCQDIWDRGKVPIIVGGSTMYIKSLFYTQEDLPQPSSEDIHAVSKKDNQTLWKELLLIDPIRAQEIDPADTYRLQRAMLIWKSTGRKPSSFQMNFDPVAPFCFIEMVHDRAVLYERIDKRVDIMMQEGWPTEVQSLIGTEWETFLMRKKMMGYDLLLDHLREHDEVTPKIVRQIQKITRNYAKRQVTFYKKLKKELVEAVEAEKCVGIVQECNLTLSDLSLYIKQLSVDLYKIFSHIKI